MGIERTIVDVEAFQERIEAQIESMKEEVERYATEQLKPVYQRFLEVHRQIRRFKNVPEVKAAYVMTGEPRHEFDADDTELNIKSGGVRLFQRVNNRTYTEFVGRIPLTWLEDPNEFNALIERCKEYRRDQGLAKEREDRATYERLKQKFEG